MALKAVVDTLDGLADGVKEQYRKDDESGKFVLDVEIEEHPGARGLKSALTKEREARAAAGTKVTELEKSVSDLKKQIETKSDKGGDTTDLEKRLAKREAELRAEFEPAVKERDQLKVQLAKRDRGDQTRTAAREAKILPDRYDDAMLAAQPYLDFRDGKLVVLDADGDPSSMSPEKFFKEKFREMKPWYYEGTNASGTGGKGGETPPPAGTVTLTKAEAENFTAYAEALKKVGGDHAKIKIAT